MGNRHGRVVATHVTQPGYHAECESAVEMLASLLPSSRRRTLGADKGYDRAAFVAAVRGRLGMVMVLRFGELLRCW